MDPLSQDSIIARQRERILARIEKANQLIDEYEYILLSSDNPKETLRAKAGITDTEQLRIKYESQLAEFQQVRRQLEDQDALENETPTREEKVKDQEKKDQNQLDSLEKTTSYNVKELDKKLEELQRGIDDLKRGQSIIYKFLNETRNQELKSVIAYIRQGGSQHHEMAQMLEIIHEALSALQENQMNLSKDIREAVTDASSAINSEGGIQGKLEITLPIIPLLLDYKVELSAANKIDLNKIWQNTQNWWSSLTLKASTKVAEELVNKYYLEFQNKHNYLLEIEKKIQQSTSNITILITANEELSGLASLSRSFTREVEELGILTDYPKDGFERISELANSLADELHSAAGAIANNGNPAMQFNQIKRNLPVLQATMLQLLTWFQQKTGKKM